MNTMLNQLLLHKAFSNLKDCAKAGSSNLLCGLFRKLPYFAVADSILKLMP
jgi:hypothetical protein